MSSVSRNLNGSGDFSEGSESASSRRKRADRIEKSDNRLYARARLLIISMVALFVLEGILLFYKSAIIPGLNQEADMFRETAVLRAENQKLVCGEITDRNGKTIVSSELEYKYEDGKITSSEQISHYLDEYAFTQVVGYTSGVQRIDYEKQLDLKTGRKFRTFAEKRDKEYRLMEYLAHGDQNVLYKNQDADSNTGSKVMLTLDADFQIWLTDFLKNQIGEGEYGSITVMDARTGAVIGMAAQPTFNVNDKEAEDKYFLSIPLTHKWSVRPGSIFKLLTAAALIENGMEDYTVSDEAFEVGDAKFVNSYAESKGTLDYAKAFRYSSNVFFAHAAIELGYEKMTEMVHRFHLDYDHDEKEGTVQEFDFGSVETNWNLADIGKAELGFSGFGYGGTELSGVSAAIMTSAFANEGVIMTPHLIKQISDGGEKDKVRAEEEISELARPVSEETADKITKALEYTVEGYIADGRITGHHIDQYRNYQIRAKTGTGDVKNHTGRENAGSNAAWVVSYVLEPAGEGEARYVVVMNHVETDARGSRYLNAVGDVYEYLFTHIDQQGN